MVRPSIGVVGAIVTLLVATGAMFGCDPPESSSTARSSANPQPQVSTASPSPSTPASTSTPSPPLAQGSPVPLQATSLSRYSTLEDEKAAYRLWGWKWTADQEPSGPPNPPGTYVSSLGPEQDVHGDFEADDLWQNLLMFKRTDNPVYRQMAANWAEYYINYYESDLNSGGNPDSAYGYDHLFGFGLIDWFEESGDQRALATAIRLGNISLAHYRSSNSLRLDARHLLLATRLWEKTGEARWRAHMDRIRNDLFNMWPVAEQTPNAYDPVRGVWMLDREEPGLHVTANAVHLGWLNRALARYYEATGSTDTAVRDRLIAMTRFVQQYGLNPADGQSGSYIAFDTGSPVYSSSTGNVATTYWIDTLVRGYRLTGDRALLVRAKLHWQNGTNAPAGQVGRFVNRSWLSNTPFYRFNGELSYVHLLFYDDVHPADSQTPTGQSLTAQPPATAQPLAMALPRATAQLPTASQPPTVSTPPVTSQPPATSPIPLPPPSTSATTQTSAAGLDLNNNEWRRLNPKTSNRYVPTDFTPTNTLTARPNPVGRSYSGIHYGDGKIFYFGGGHGSYSGNDVEIYDIGANIWQQSYKPEVCDVNDSKCKGIYGGTGTDALTPLGRPYVEHTFQKLVWNPLTRRWIGLLTAGTFSYDPATSLWTRLGPSLIGWDIFAWNLLSWDPDVGVPIAIVWGPGPVYYGGIQTGVYKLISGVWHKIGDVPAIPPSLSYCSYMPDRQTHLCLLFTLTTNSVSFWTFNARTLSWTRVASPPAGVNIASTDYDTRNRVVIGVDHSDIKTFTVWAYDPGANTWTQLAPPAIRPAQAQGLTAWSQKLRYDPINNVFVFLAGNSGSGGSGGWTETWAYRYRR